MAKNQRGAAQKNRTRISSKKLEIYLKKPETKKFYRESDSKNYCPDERIFSFEERLYV
jgi:hypothetical protein